MKRLVFENSKFFCFLLAILFAFAAVCLFNNKSYFYAIFFFVLFVAFLFSMFYQEEGVVKLEVCRDKVSFFIRENKKVFIKSFNFEQLEEFKLNISHMVNYDKISSKSRDPIELNFIIKLVDAEVLNYMVKLPETLSINRVFDVLSTIPTFKFEVFTNSDAFGTSLSEYALNNKKVSIKESLDIMLKDPKEPKFNKDFTNVLSWILIFELVFILPFVVLLVKDIVWMICR